MYTSFIIHFLIGSIPISFLMIAILLIKKLLRNHISQKFQYYIWFIFLFMLITPFFPSQLFHKWSFSRWVPKFGQTEPITEKIWPLKNQSLHLIPKTDWLNDFYVSVNRPSFHMTNRILLSIWLLGMLVMLILTYFSYRKIRNLKKAALLNPNIEMTILFEDCKKKLGIDTTIRLYLSSLVTSPITFGFLHPEVILPDNITSELTTEEIRHIFLHELQHYKNKDLLINYMICCFRILYWFHPLVWYAFREMRADCEIACDISVLKILDEDSYINYGNTIIHFADKYLRSFPRSSASQIGGSKAQIKKRIIKIASFEGETKWIEIKSILIFTLIGIIAFSSTPFLAAGNYISSNYTFVGNNVKYEDLHSYFDGYKGCFVLYDLKNDQYHIFNQKQSQERVSPDSTYKIYSGLFALEEGSITEENSLISWDGVTYPYDSWNQNQDLSSAMKNSVNWYFQSLDQKAGIPLLKSYYNKIGYGNVDLSNDVSNYWMESSLKISPIEQVKLLKDFYKNTFSFKEENIQAIKNALFLSKSNSSYLYGKTGTGNVNGKNINGWYIGYVEKNDNTYFFATNIQSDDSSTGSTAAKITLSILDSKNIYPIKK